MSPLTIALLVLAALLALLVGAGVLGFIRGGHRQRDSDVFAGTRRSVQGLPEGWICYAHRWRWALLEVDRAERVKVYGLEVQVRNPATRALSWLPVGAGMPQYHATDHEPPDVPGSWEQDQRRIPMGPNGETWDPAGQLKSCRVHRPPRFRGFRV